MSNPDSRRQSSYSEIEIKRFGKLETENDLNIYKTIFQKHITKNPQDLNRLVQVLGFGNTYEDVKTKMGIILALISKIKDPWIYNSDKQPVASIKNEPLKDILNDNILTVLNDIVAIQDKLPKSSTVAFKFFGDFSAMIPVILSELTEGVKVEAIRIINSNQILGQQIKKES